MLASKACRCSSSFPTRPRSSAASSRSAASRAASSRTSTARRSSSTARRPCERGRARTGRGAGRARPLQDEGLPERRPAAALRARRARRRRLDARRARVRAAAGIPGERARRARQQQVRRGACAAAAARLRSSSSTRPTRPSARQPPASSRRSCASRPGIDADTHEAIAPGTTARSSGCRPTRRSRRSAAARRGLDVEGLHVHVGSQLARRRRGAVGDRLARRLRRPLPRRARLDAGGRRRRRRPRGPVHVDGRPELPWLAVRARARSTASSARGRCTTCRSRASSSSPAARSSPGRRHALPRRRGQAGRRATTYVAVDGGMSDNPRPQLYGARYTALLANRADEEPAGAYAIAGKHCESGDVLIERVALPEPRRGDLLAVPATGAYTLAMSSNYNARAAPGGRARRGRRGAADPPPRDGRRPARARG